MKVWGLLSLGLVVPVAVACTGEDAAVGGANSGALDAGVVTPGLGGATIVVDDVVLSAKPADTIVNRITVQRKGVTGEVVITVPGLPANVTAAPLTIPEGSSEGDLLINATIDAKAARITLNLQADVDGMTVKHPTPLVVRGRAGTRDETASALGVSPITVGTTLDVPLVVDEQERIYVLGDNCTIERHLATGVVDAFTAPSINAATTGMLGKTPYCSRLAVRGGTIAVAGLAQDASGAYAFVLRVSPDGTLASPPYFGEMVTADQGQRSAFVGGIALDADGTARVGVESFSGYFFRELHIVGVDGMRKNTPQQMGIGGSNASWAFPAEGGGRVFVQVSNQLNDGAFDKDGRLDPAFTAFGNTGYSVSFGSGIPQGNMEAHAMALDASGHAIGAAAAYQAGNPGVNRRIFLTSHSVKDGWVHPMPGTYIDFSASSSDAGSYRYAQVAIDRITGAIVTGGRDATGPFVRRFTANGQPDVAFGTDGYQRFPDFGAGFQVYGLVLQRDGAVALVDNGTGGASLVRFWL